VPLAVEGPARICPVCGLEKRCISHVQNEILAIEPARLYVIQYQREKLACPDEHDGVVTAAAAPRVMIVVTDPAQALEPESWTASREPTDRLAPLPMPLRSCAVLSTQTVRRWTRWGSSAVPFTAVVSKIFTVRA